MSDASERLTLQDRVYAGLSTDIAQGVIEPGEKLRVVHLAKRFGTSQAPVREALRRLTEEGLADTIPYIGTVVKTPTWEEIQEIYALRAELEAYAIRRTIALGAPGLTATARRGLRELRRAVRSESELEVVDADLVFHRSICALSASTLTLEMWDSLIRRFRGLRLALMRQHPDTLETIMPSHERLVEALESGDARRAEAAIREHLTDAVASFAEKSGNTLDSQLFSA